MTEEVVTSSVQNHFARYSHIESELIIDGCQPNLLPDLSVMIPTFRRPHLLKEAIESVVNQTAHGINVEIVIVDNDAEKKSTELIALIESFFPNNIRLFRNKENIGMFGNWNRCIELARAPKLTILNDDDLLYPDFIRAVYEPDEKEMRVVTHKTFSILAECVGSAVKPDIKFASLTTADFFIGNPVPGSLGMIMDRQCALVIGGYNQEYWPTADFDFTYRYFLAYGLKKTNTVLSAYRWAENESLKIETLSGFLKNDYAFRIRMLETMQSDVVIDKCRLILCNMITTYYSVLYSHMNSEFKADENINSLLVVPLGLSFFKIKIIHRLFGLFYPTLVKLIF